MTDVAAARLDRYRTRLPPERPLPPLQRSVPTVYGEPAQLAKITGIGDAAARFERDGFLVLAGFFEPADAARWRQEAERIAARCTLEHPVEAFFESRSNALRSVFDVARFSTELAALLDHPRLVELAAAIVGGATYVHQSRVNYKPALTGSGFFWHSDFETWHAEDGMPDMRAVSVSISLCDNSPFNGPLLLIPGSHRTFVPCIGATPDDHYRRSLVKQEYGTPPRERLAAMLDEHGIDAATGPAGTVVVFDCNMLHASAQNLSGDDRINLFVVYNSRDNALQAPFAAPRPRPTFIAARPRSTPPERDPRHG